VYVGRAEGVLCVCVQREVSKEEDEMIMKRAPLVEKEKKTNQIEEERVFGDQVMYGDPPIQVRRRRCCPADCTGCGGLTSSAGWLCSSSM